MWFSRWAATCPITFLPAGWQEFLLPPFSCKYPPLRFIFENSFGRMLVGANDAGDFDPIFPLVTFSEPLIQGRRTWRQTCVNATVCTRLSSTRPPPHLTLHLSHPLIRAEEIEGRHYGAFGCLWVTLPHIWGRHWAQYPDALAVGPCWVCAHELDHTLEWSPSYLRDLPLPCLLCGWNTGGRGVSHTRLKHVAAAFILQPLRRSISGTCKTL